MHEFSIASEIVQNVLDAANKNKAKKILSIQLEIGELSLLNLEQVRFWIQELFRETAAEGAQVKIKEIKAHLRCHSCQYKGKEHIGDKDFFSHFTPLACPRCGSLEVEIEKGRECMLRKIQAVK